ncbi:hypothetical protein [Nitrososphaera sp.]|uniref:hypothetical protein n=1 Tax=Nitrososphaera sp. TaxID=1971748 RepID=UPI00182BF24B|nr:hypothetical protein [Nitrososphaera sp.]NWG36745.1 hypothetical protein [Nitrososphaera sp.]
MTLESKSNADNLQDWFSNLIDHFREEYEKISDEEKSYGVDTSVNYRFPCQIEVFWLENPEIQLIFKFNSGNRPDKEIIIHGPLDSHNFIDRVEPILKEPRWSEVSSGRRPYLDEPGTTLAFTLARHLHRLVEMAKAMHFERRVHRGSGMGLLEGTNIWTSYHYGNIAEQDYVTIVNEILRETRSRAKNMKERSEGKAKEKVHVLDKPRDNPKAYGVHFFPPIFVGRQPELTPSDVLYGRISNMPYISPFENGISMSFGKHAAIVNADGFIFIPISNKEIALRALNVIMAVGMLRGLDFLAVREHELSTIEYNKETMTPGSMTYDPEVTLRTRQFLDRMGQGTSGYRRREIDEMTLRQIVAKAGRIFDEGKYVEDLRLLSESFTHFNDAEYAPSFVMSWSIIERHISKLWKKKVDEKDLDEDRTNKLLDTNRWSADYLLEVLNLNEEISEDDYDRYMEMKSKRNRFIHRGKQIVREDAERCFNIAKEIVVRKVGSLNRNKISDFAALITRA